VSCAECNVQGGCDARKGEERELLAALLPALYPRRRWGEPDDRARHGAGIGPHSRNFRPSWTCSQSRPGSTLAIVKWSNSR